MGHWLHSCERLKSGLENFEAGEFMATKAYFDAHCHLAHPALDARRELVLKSAREFGIAYFIQGGIDPEDWQRQLDLSEDGWLTCFGLHPWSVAERSMDRCLEALEQLRVMLPQAFALGELGLDYGPRFAKSTHPQQREIFRLQLQMARSQNKPVVLHLVGCHGEAPVLIKKEGEFRGIVHGFTGAYEVARNYLDLGLLLSIGPAVAKDGYLKLKNAVSRLPLSRLIIESDTPDLASAGSKASLEEPAAIALAAQAVAEIRGISAQAVLEASRDNLAAYFGLELV